MGIDLSMAASCFAMTSCGSSAVTLIAVFTLAGTGARTWTLPVSVCSVVRSRTAVPFLRCVILPA